VRENPLSLAVPTGINQTWSMASVNGDLKLIQFWRSQRFKTDTPPSPAHAGFSLLS
jgi:hypothetical protein